MILNTLLLDAYTSFYTLIATASGVFLAALELVFTMLYFKKRESVFFVLFLLPAVATVCYAKWLIDLKEDNFTPIGVCSFAFVLLLLGANVREMFRK
jgi:hypothetical protein